MKHALLTFSLMFALSGGASAADAVSAMHEIAPPSFSWTGAYAGAQAGYLWGEGCYCIEIFPGAEANGDINGWAGGIYAGYNLQFPNNLVLGVDADLVRYGVDDFVQFADPTFPQRSGANYKLKWGGAARLRVGYAMGRWMPYLAGGAAFAKGEITELYNGRVLQRNEMDLTGWTLGGGVDYALTDKVIVRGEYRYTDFGDFSIERGLQSGAGNVTASDLRLGIAYKF